MEVAYLCTITTLTLAMLRVCLVLALFLSFKYKRQKEKEIDIQRKLPPIASHDLHWQEDGSRMPELTALATGTLDH